MQTFDKPPWYRDGIFFSCSKCSSCCRGESGYVFLSREDAQRLGDSCDLKLEEFIQTYCRWVDDGAEKLLSLKEKSSYDCIFWKNGCSVYKNRPLQCRTYPFWPSMLESKEIWAETSSSCPGVKSKKLKSFLYIQKLVKLEKRWKCMIKSALNEL
ncbi:MAG: YkgJ family cysteine cluster protein [Spirochaetaceae bacterium]|jgi:Fe-S-cluster containining protein|nr:YkgJ family cysteine cluster protein [Spirochaetaceae bacterium]